MPKSEPKTEPKTEPKADIKTKYYDGEKVLCYHGKLLYEAKVPYMTLLLLCKLYTLLMVADYRN